MNHSHGKRDTQCSMMCYRCASYCSVRGRCKQRDSRTLVNRLRTGVPVEHTQHVPSGDALPVFEAAARYERESNPVVLVAGEHYGTDSSRNHTAKGRRLLGIRAVLSASFERIHRSNLIGMGILPLRFAAGIHPDTLYLQPGDKLEVGAPANALSPRCGCAVPVRIVRAAGRIESVSATAAVETRLECELLRSGGVIPLILQKNLATQEA